MKMFAEYRIKPDCDNAYIEFVRQLKSTYPNVRVYEGVGQPGLFVEEWTDLDEQHFQSLKAERTESQHPLWLQLDAIVVGGRSKTNAWLFREFC